MKAYIRITDERGMEFEGEADLSPVNPASAKSRAFNDKRRKPIKVAAAHDHKAKLVFTKPERAFVKTYARGMNGQKKFVLLVAYLTKGGVGKEIEVKELQRHWNKMTASNLLGLEYNGKYATFAKDHGWVDAPRHGVYVLTESWKEILENNG